MLLLRLGGSLEPLLLKEVKFDWSAWQACPVTFQIRKVDWKYTFFYLEVPFFQTFFFGLFTSWIRDLNTKDLGNVSSGVPGYFDM